MNQRINQLVNSLKELRKVRSAADLARMIQLDKAELSRMMTGKKPVNQLLVDKLLKNFPEINEVWLRTGEGEMLKNVALAENQAVALAADEIKDNKISVNTDQAIALLVAELSAQRRLAEKIIDQNGEILLQNRELLAMVKNK